jgi:hypothetical protein
MSPDTQELDAYERLDANLERLQELHAQIAAAETQQQRLQAREAERNWEGRTTQRTTFRSQADAEWRDNSC